MSETDAKRCLDCGYILDGLPAPRCPECGRAFVAEDPWTYSAAGASSSWPHLVAAIVGCAAFIASLATAHFPQALTLSAYREVGPWLLIAALLTQGTVAVVSLDSLWPVAPSGARLPAPRHGARRRLAIAAVLALVMLGIVLGALLLALFSIRRVVK